MNDSVPRLVSALLNTYTPTIELNYSNNFELLIAVILSAQCTDKMVNKVTPILFTQIKTMTPEAQAYLKKTSNAETMESIQIAHVATMPAERLEELIHSTGFYKAKATNIQKTARKLLENFHGTIPDSMEKLLTLSGVARKTANVILSTVYDKNEGVVVDTHVKRISQRLRFVDPAKLSGREKVIFKKNNHDMLDYLKDADPVVIEKMLMDTVSAKYWGTLPHLLIKLGRDVCKAQNPQCSRCIISSYCPVSRVAP